MIAKTYSRFGINMIAAIEDGMIYLEGNKIAGLLGYDNPELAVIKYLGTDTYTPLKLNRSDEVQYLITGANKNIDKINEILLWIVDICDDLTWLAYD